MVVTLELRATQSGVIWPRRPLVSSKGLLSCLQNVPHSSYDRRATAFRAVAFNAAGDGFAATDEKGRVFVFFVTSNKYALVQHVGAPTVACCFSPTRKSELLVTSENEMVRCIDVQSQSLISSLRGHRFPAKSASFQKSGNLALTASQDAVILWDTKDWSRYRVLNAGPGVEEATFVAKGDLVAVCFQDDSIMMWELNSLALRYRFSLPAQEQPAGITKIAVSDDYKILVATGRSQFIYVWDFEAQTIIRIIELPAPIEDVLTFSFVPGQDSTICLLGNEGSLFFLNVAAKKPKIKMEISNPGRVITSFDIENHGRYLVACTDDGCLLLYDLDIAMETARRAHQTRRQQGLHDFDDNLRLRTRSVIPQSVTPIVGPNATARSEEEDEGERPASSKLIDGIFGSRTKRDKENIVTEQRIEFQEKRPTRANANRLHSPHNAVAPTPLKSVAIPTTNLSAGHKQKKKSVLQMTSLSDAEVELNRKRLQNSLDCNGKYPAKYRLLVWKFLLRLPKNDDAFKALVAKGPHPAYLRLHELYPLKNQRQLRRLNRVLSAIAYWCPAFGEVSYLPAVVYPFVKIYRENDVAAFEASLSILLHWCGDFLVSLPYPPVFVLSTIETQLEKADSQLHDHFVKLDVSPEVYAWNLLKSIFTEVLSEDEWMCLWDHLISASDKPRFLYVAVIAYLAYFRVSLLAAKDRYSIEQFFHQQNAIQIHGYIQLLKNLSEKIGDMSGSAQRVPMPSYWPLSKNQYPAFANYPKFIVDYQITERNRIALEEAEMIQKKKLLQRIESESEKLKAEHEKWLRQKQALLAAEEKRRNEMLSAEKSRILNLKTLDHETRKRRLERLAELERSAHETLEQTSTLFQAEYLRLESELGMLRERSDFELASRQQEEELQRIEFETEKRVADIHKQREIEERLQQLRTEFVTRIKQDELQDILLFESWKRDDESNRLKAKQEIDLREKDALLQQERTIRQQLENKLLDHTLKKEKQLRELQTLRDARVEEERTNHQLAEDFAEQERNVAGELRLDHDRQKSRVTSRSRNQDLREEPSSLRSLNGAEQRVHVARRARDDDADEETTLNDAVAQAQRRRTSQQTARKIRSNLDSISGRPSHCPSLSADGVRADDQDDEFDGAEHVTNESIRLLDTARRRLSSVLHHSNENDSSSSDASSFVSTPVVRTTQEQSLLEKALADISSSSGSSTGEQSPSARPSPTATSRRGLFEGISPIQTMREDRSLSLANASALLQEENHKKDHTTHEAHQHQFNTETLLIPMPSSQTRLRVSLPSLSSGDESEEASSMLQRPIEELEKELGIRFDDMSEEEKEGDSDDDGDDELEDDRAQLLQRAKKLLAEHSLVSDDEDDDPRAH